VPVKAVVLCVFAALDVYMYMYVVLEAFYFTCLNDKLLLLQILKCRKVYLERAKFNGGI